LALRLIQRWASLRDRRGTAKYGDWQETVRLTQNSIAAHSRFAQPSDRSVVPESGAAPQIRESAAVNSAQVAPIGRYRSRMREFAAWAVPTKPKYIPQKEGTRQRNSETAAHFIRHVANCLFDMTENLASGACI
jgi:hypothetical protein